MAEPTDRRPRRPRGRRRDQIRTAPPILLLVGGAGEPGQNGEATAAALIALARAARREATGGAESS
jgi:hypothetical protein